ncbi:phage terminase large subunit family protein [Methylorubrum thiocyanatum]|uniref:phage terminase large subunit family protein n=1 Tax=Methylorubrum thiocyanatum TaxID=47958 RepID=UPI003659A3D8
MSESISPNAPSPASASRADALVNASWGKGYLPDPVLSVSEWADNHRVLSRKAASEPGMWRTARTPYLREIMDVLSTASPVQRVVFMKGAQVGGTEAGNNWIGYVIHQAPGPMLAVQPTTETAKRNSRQRIAPLIDECDSLRDLVKEPRARDSGNTVQSKEFPGGVLVMTGANSAAGLRSMPARYLFLDEVDAFPGDVEGEGDPIALAEARTRTFQRRKVFIVSTPTIAGRSRVEREYQRSDQRRFFVPCPHCDHFQPLRFDRLRWDKGFPEKAQYACEECGALCGEHHKTEMLRRGEWRATAPGEGRAAGFHLSSLYSPVGWMSWVEIAQRWEAAQGDQELLKEFINTVLGETWKDGADAARWQDVYARRGEHLTGTVSRNALVLFAGADVQKDRIEVSVWAFGRNRERWLVEHRVLPGATNQTQVWADLESMFDETWQHESGGEMSVRDWGIDSGAFTSEVYAFVRSQRGRGNVHAVDGQDSYSSAFLGVGAKDATAAGKKLRRGLKTLRIGSSFCKQELLGALTLDRPESGQPFPAGFVHLPRDVTEDQVKQLTAEELSTRTRRGRTIREWSVIAGRRNEVLDCANYARGLAAMRGWDRWREKQWRSLEDALGIRPDSVAPSLEVAAPAVVAGSLADRSMKRSVRRSVARRGPARW